SEERFSRNAESRHLARKLSLRRKRSSPNVFEMAATETITSIILIKLIRVSLGTVRHPRRFTCDDKSAQIYARFDKNDWRIQPAEFYRFHDAEVNTFGYFR